MNKIHNYVNASGGEPQKFRAMKKFCREGKEAVCLYLCET